jgi:Icc-related predicted phosphoesterase
LRIWLLSDLHLEMSVWDLPVDRPSFDVLVIAGDLIPRAERGVKWLRERFPDSQVNIVYVLGNHERYGSDYELTLEKAREAASGSHIYILENSAVTIDGVEFVGATFWTNFALFGDETVPAAMAVAEDRMNDYKRIRKDHYGRRLRAADTLARHEESVAFLRDHCAKDPDHPRVIVTHHSIDPLAVPARLRENLVAAAYSSDLLGLVEELHPQYWMSGHIHDSNDRTVGQTRQTRLLSNPKGYGPFTRAGDPWQNHEFDPRLTVTF